MQNRKRPEEFAKKFLYDSKSSFTNKTQSTLPATSANQQQSGSGMSYGTTARSHTQQHAQGDYYTDQQQQGGSGMTYTNTGKIHTPPKSQEDYYADQHEATAQGYTQRSTQGDYYTDQEHLYMAGAGGDANIEAIKSRYGGDGNIEVIKARYNNGSKDVRCKRSLTRQARNRNTGETFSEHSQSSSRSDSSRRTTIEQGKKGKQLMKLTHSKANLLKTVDEGMSSVQQEHCCCNNKMMTSGPDQQCPKEIIHSGSEDSNACSSPSAGLINEKIIHPMVKKFRLLYLHNIKEEVTIMEDLEMLPHKLDEICRKMEKE